jgi:hypothetical protein
MPAVNSANDTSLDVSDNELVIDTPERLATLAKLRAKFEQPKIQVAHKVHVESLSRLLLELKSEVTAMKIAIEEIQIQLFKSGTANENPLQKVDVEFRREQRDDTVHSSTTRTASPGSMMSSVSAILNGEAN